MDHCLGAWEMSTHTHAMGTETFLHPTPSCCREKHLVNTEDLSHSVTVKARHLRQPHVHWVGSEMLCESSWAQPGFFRGHVSHPDGVQPTQHTPRHSVAKQHHHLGLYTRVMQTEISIITTVSFVTVFSLPYFTGAIHGHLQWWDSFGR